MSHVQTVRKATTPRTPPRTLDNADCSCLVTWLLSFVRIRNAAAIRTSIIEIIEWKTFYVISIPFRSQTTKVTMKLATERLNTFSM